MSIILSILIAIHILVCALMILVVLMQRPRSEGLGSAFGGGLTDNVFGSQTTNVLARFTTWMGIAFFAITLLLSILTAKANSGKTAVQKKLLSEPLPAAVSTPTPAPLSTPEATPATPTASATPVAEPVQETPQATPEVETAPLEPAPEASPEATAPAQN
ncbi:MAG: preprotein translocase subunit SecG [Verrucomicrobia bacterium]|jgi:preprotein translocase subunit SecG|nr:preprotein translocase subunit SecG [Verrucomicrobiota bacterium]